MKVVFATEQEMLMLACSGTGAMEAAVTNAGGQEHLKGKIFRISHMGFMDNFDIAVVISALELTLKELGFPLSLGVGLKAAQEELFSNR